MITFRVVRTPELTDTARKDAPVATENHLVEWKESWRDEYLRWLCGFANADGGTLIIGRNDQGQPEAAQTADEPTPDRAS